ncbi:MAG: EAL domain-containing protein, partial [Clostridia bacterium]|nr:EAL domain-containing protein [Clostridia bacterium]
GVDTVCEGVETKEQVDFLVEIGCSKLQGFYYSRPISPENIMEKVKSGDFIGYEDRKQSGYYDAIGRVNLYDLAVLTDGSERGLNNFYNTLPMAIIEIFNGNIRFVRSNKSYRMFLQSKFGINLSNFDPESSKTPYGAGSALMNLVKQCCETDNRAFFDEEIPDGSTIHSYARKIGTNPETGAVAVAIAVLSIIEPERGTSYANIARALATDYFNLFYVDLETEKFIKYTSDVGDDKIAMERHGEDFFNASRREAATMLYPEDVEGFLSVFTKENVVRELEEQGAFMFTYRQFIKGVPTYVNMKATRMLNDGRYIIIGVSNVDSQMKNKELLDRIHKEQTAYSRLMALSGNYICLYTVDPETGHYTEYEATSDYAGLGFDKNGTDFFSQGRIDGEKTVVEEDLPKYLDNFTKEKVLSEVKKNGRYELGYRLKIKNKEVNVKMRAAMVKESDIETLIVGVVKTDE